MAMVLDATSLPLRQAEIPRSVPGEDEVLLKVSACGVCHADLHVLEGDLPQPKLALIPGHEIVGVVVSKGRMWSAHHRPSGPALKAKASRIQKNEAEKEESILMSYGRPSSSATAPGRQLY